MPYNFQATKMVWMCFKKHTHPIEIQEAFESSSWYTNLNVLRVFHIHRNFATYDSLKGFMSAGGALFIIFKFITEIEC